MKFLPVKLKKIRDKKGITLRQLSLLLSDKGVNISPKTLNNWERGLTEPRPSSVSKLTSFFKLPPHYFYEYTSRYESNIPRLCQANYTESGGIPNIVHCPKKKKFVYCQRYYKKRNKQCKTCKLYQEWVRGNEK